MNNIETDLFGCMFTMKWRCVKVWKSKGGHGYLRGYGHPPGSSSLGTCSSPPKWSLIWKLLVPATYQDTFYIHWSHNLFFIKNRKTFPQYTNVLHFALLVRDLIMDPLWKYNPDIMSSCCCLNIQMSVRLFHGSKMPIKWLY